MSQDITDISGIGPKTEQKLRRRLRKNRPTSRAGEKVSLRDVEQNQEIARFVLTANQQRSLKDTDIRFKLDHDARKKEAAASQKEERQESDTIRRGDFRVGKDDIRSARDRFGNLDEEARTEDKNSREPVTTDLGLWRENIGRFDFPGVDTPSNRRVRANPSDSVLNGTISQQRPRENWRDSQPEQTPTQERLGEQPDKADAERTGIYRSSNGEFVQRPLQPTASGGFVSENGRRVSGLQDPTIGRDPDDGEFEDMPLGNEPSVPLPDLGFTQPESEAGAEKTTADNGLSQASERALDAGVAVAGFGSQQFDATDDETPDPFALGGTTQAPLSAAKVTDDDPADALGDSTVGTLRETVDYLETEYDGDPQEELDGFGEFATAVRSEAQLRGGDR